ncbi:MAG: hypothetical protein EBZ69_07020, partial [Alphaproteobacteria bacterium]|nr:hypothetical protein [Alphaproteobacteria bacterium]
PETLVYSSNIATAQIADRLGAQKLHSSFDALGLLKPATLEIPEIGKPLVPPTPWKNITTMTAAYGHGLAVSPLQILGGLAALSGQGQFVAPTLLHKKRVAAGETVFKPETVQRMRALMRLVVTHGTAKSAEAKGYMVAGKTGTAEKVTAKGYDKNSRIASFAGVFPIHAPRYALFVMFDNPQGTKETYGFATAGWVAAPAAGDIIARAAPVLGLAPLDAEDEAIAEQILFKPIQSLVAGLPKDNTVSPVHKETEIHKETKTQKPQDTHAPVTTASAR